MDAPLEEALRELRRLAEREPSSPEALAHWYEDVKALTLGVLAERDVADRLPHVVWHYLQDADVRLRDPRDGEQQRRAFVAALDELAARCGAVP